MAAHHPITPDVEYKDIPGFLGYCFGDDGSIWSCRWRGRIGGLVPWRRLKTNFWKDRYFYATLIGPSGKKSYPVSQLILMAFVGPRPPGAEACHFPDKDPRNNRPSNLMWGTKAVNASHRAVHGTNIRGSDSIHAKLTELQVREIRAAVDGGERVGVVAKRFSVTDSAVSCILRGFTWNHLRISDEHLSKGGKRRSSGWLSDDTIREIFRLRVDGISMRKIAIRLRISYSHVNRILHRKVRKTVEIY
jgi:hypothetical protein